MTYVTSPDPNLEIPPFTITDLNVWGARSPLQQDLVEFNSKEEAVAFAKGVCDDRYVNKWDFITVYIKDYKPNSDLFTPRKITNVNEQPANAQFLIMPSFGGELFSVESRYIVGLKAEEFRQIAINSEDFRVIHRKKKIEELNIEDWFFEDQLEVL